MEKADVIIIGAGVLGCFAARAVAEYDLKTLVLEQREDVCTGISRANTGTVCWKNGLPGGRKTVFPDWNCWGGRKYCAGSPIFPWV